MREAMLIVFFDLPVESSKQKRQYRELIKFLLADGYIRFQKSVYIKKITNISTANCDIERIKTVSIDEGDVSLLVINYKYFQKMNTIKGNGFDKSFFEEKVMFL